MKCFRISKTLRNGREVNKKLRKQYVCCIHNVYDVAVLAVCFLKIGECREVLGGGPAPPSKL